MTRTSEVSAAIRGEPSDVVQRQLDAYNAKDIDALLATYTSDAEQWVLHGERLAHGHAELRVRFLARFAEADLHAELLSRIAMGDIVVDHELVTRNFAEGKGTVELLCIYEVTNGVIRRASFAFGERMLER